VRFFSIAGTLIADKKKHFVSEYVYQGMKLRIVFFLFCFLKWNSGLFSQQGYSYKEYDRGDCISVERSYSRMPDELLFQVEKIDNTFFAIFNDERWFDDFFAGDGSNLLLGNNALSLGVQLVSADYFSCNYVGFDRYDDFFYHLDPFSYKEMKKFQERENDGLFRIPLGTVPPRFLNKEFDHGIVISKKNHECISHWYTKTPILDWQLLELALLTDTLVTDSEKLVFHPDTSGLSLGEKLEIDVIFPKNETSFDLKKFREFLHHIPSFDLEPYKVSISAFASIEGPETRNKELYERRGEVVKNEIELILPSGVQYEIKVDENWDEFYLDVANSEFSWLTDMEPEQIRAQLSDRTISKELEPLLKKHRKATVTVWMRKEIQPDLSDMPGLIDFYVASLQAEHLENTLKIQDAIFELVDQENVSALFPDSLPLPTNKLFSYVFTRDYVYRYKTGLVDHAKLFQLFDDLKDYYPNDPAIRFNLAELAFRSWVGGDHSINADSVLGIINNLDQFDVPVWAKNRLLINFHLVSIRQSMAEADARKRLRSARAIRSLYTSSFTTDDELVNLARFFSAYRQTDVAERLLRPYARNNNPDEDLLYFYIILTINEATTVNMRWYNDLLEKAYEINPQRFCSLFQPVSSPGSAGISLLFRDRIKEFFCQNCYDPS
jgi:hypothetical protein